MNSITSEVAVPLEAHDITITPEHIASVLNFECQALCRLSQGAAVSGRLTAILPSSPRARSPSFSWAWPKAINTTEWYAAAPPRDTRQGGFRQVEKHPLPTLVLLCSEDSRTQRERKETAAFRYATFFHGHQFAQHRRSQHSRTLPCRQFQGLQCRVLGHHVWSLSRALLCGREQFRRTGVAVSPTLVTASTSRHFAHLAATPDGRQTALDDLFGGKDGAECLCFFGLCVGDVVCFPFRVGGGPHRGREVSAPKKHSPTRDCSVPPDSSVLPG